MANEIKEEQDYGKLADLAELQYCGIRRVTTLEVLLFVARRKKEIALVTICFTVISVILCFVLRVQYTATATIMPPQQNPSIASALASQIAGLSGSLPSGMGLSGLSLKDPNLIYLRVLDSTPVLDALISRYKLKDAYGAKDMTEARKKLRARTSFISEKANTISISVTDPDKVRATNLANAYIEEFRKVSKTVAIGEASRKREFFEEQLRDEGESLVQAQIDLQKLQSKGVIDVNTMSKSAFILAENLRANLLAKQAQLKVLEQSSTESNAQVQSLKSEIEELNRQLSHINRPSNSSEATAFSLGDIPSKGLEFIRAQHQVLYHQALYDSLLKQLDIARLDESKDAVQIQVLEPALIPEHKSKPRRTMIVVIGILFGLFVSVLWSIVAGWSGVWMENPSIAAQLRSLRQAVSFERP